MTLSDEGTKTHESRIGPLRVTGVLQASFEATCFEALSPEAQHTRVWRWPAEALSKLSIPGIAHLIDTMQDIEMAGVAKIVHGSVSTDHAVLAFTRPAGKALRDYLQRGKNSPLESIRSALALIDALIALRSIGLRGAWWTPDTLWVLDDEAQWTLGAPGLASVVHTDCVSRVEEVVFRAPESTQVKELSLLEDQYYAAIASYALGATLYYSLIGEFPFSAASPEAYLKAQQEGVAPTIEAKDNQLGDYGQLSLTIAQCLELEPMQRPKSLEEIRRMLEEAEQEARFQHSRVDFLPARVSETHQMPRPTRAGEGEKPSERERSKFLPLLALISLVAIALFLIGR